MDIVTRKFGYAHHYIVDELDLNQMPGDQNPAAKILAGHPLPLAITEQIKTSLMEVKPNISPWLTDTLVNYHMDGMPWSRTFGFLLTLHPGYGRLRVESLIPGSFVYDYLKDKQVEGLFLLTINGIELCSLTDINAILDDICNRSEPAVHTIMTGFTFLFGKLDTTDTNVNQLSSEEHYHAVSRSVFSLCLEALVEDDPTQDILNDLTCLFLDMDDVDPDFIAKIWSILQTASDLKCPRSFSAALKEPVHRGKWIAAFYKHLDSCYALGTYGCPKIPPADATVLPAVVVLKLVLNQLKQAAAHKIRVCVNGGLQIQGIKIMTNHTPILSFPNRSKLLWLLDAAFPGSSFILIFIMHSKAHWMTAIFMGIDCGYALTTYGSNTAENVNLIGGPKFKVYSRNTLLTNLPSRCLVCPRSC
jgi:hypothetical protein